MIQTTDWILVADRCQARLFNSTADRHGHYEEIKHFEDETGRRHRQDLESDKPGRISLPGKVRTSVEPHESPQHHAARGFAREICEYLDRSHCENRFNRLIMIAPPEFLGILRVQLTAGVKPRVTRELNKDFLSLSPSELQHRLTEVLESSTV